MYKNIQDISVQDQKSQDILARDAARSQSPGSAALQISHSSPSLTASFKHPATYGLSPDKESATNSGVAELARPTPHSVPSRPMSRQPTPVRHSAQPHPVQHVATAATASQDYVQTLSSRSSPITQHSLYTVRRVDAQCDLPTGSSSRLASCGRHVVTATGTVQARKEIVSGRQWYDTPTPQPSLLSFDSALPGRSSNSMSTQLQPRAFSASQPLSHPPLTPSHPLTNQSEAAAVAGRRQNCSAIEALRPGSKDSQSGDSALSVDVSKISFRILTSGRGWAGQRGPCSPLTPIPDSPTTPLHWCRCNIQRIRHAGNKNGQFVMLDASSGDTLVACHNAKSYAYDLFLHTAQAGQRYLGALSSSSAQDRFLLLGSMAGSQPLNLSPNVDPVQLAISYNKWSGGQQQVLAVVPGRGRGVQHRPVNPDLPEDLGDEHQIDAMLERLEKGRLVPGVQAYRSAAPLTDVALQQHVQLHGRTVLKSRKNVQLQLDSRLTAWPTVRAGTKVKMHSQAGQEHSKTNSLGLGRGSGDLLVFQCGRLAPEEFSCDFTPRMMTHAQAFCIAVSSITRKRHRYWL